MNYRKILQKSPLAIFGLILLQTLVLLIQKPNLGGDDPIKAQAVIELAHGIWPVMKFSIIQPLIIAPLYAFSEIWGLGTLAIAKAGTLAWFSWALVISIILKPYRSHKYIITVLILVFSSMLVAYLVGFNSEAFTALGVSGGLAAALLGKTKIGRSCGWVVSTFAAANIPALALGVLVAGLWLTISKRKLSYVFYPISVFCIIVLEASYQTGHIAFTKYVSEGALSPLLPWGFVSSFNHPVFFGIIAILFSFGRGLVFFIPSFFASLKRRDDPVGNLVFTLTLIVLACIPLYGAWWAWYGGVTFGPRFFLLGIIPGSFALAEILRVSERSLKTSMLTIIVIAWSSWVAIAGVAYYITPTVANICTSNGYLYEPLCWYAPEYSTLFAPFWDGHPLSVQATLLAMFVIVSTFAVSFNSLSYISKTSWTILSNWLKSDLSAKWRW